MSLQADVNVGHEWRQRMRFARQLNHEDHGSAECRFEKIDDLQIITHRLRVYILVRVCKCGWRFDKEHILKKRIVPISDFTEGVEIHVDHRCHYSRKRQLNGTLRLDKVCYCPQGLGYSNRYNGKLNCH
jgi:hypothetical protein